MDLLDPCKSYHNHHYHPIGDSLQSLPHDINDCHSVYIYTPNEAATDWA